MSAAVLTPLQALVALVGVAESALDFRPSFRRAIADAHTAIANAPLTATATLPHAQTVHIGPDADDFPEPHFELRLPPFDGVEDAQQALRSHA